MSRWMPVSIRPDDCFQLRPMSYLTGRPRPREQEDASELVSAGTGFPRPVAPECWSGVRVTADRDSAARSPRRKQRRRRSGDADWAAADGPIWSCVSRRRSLSVNWSRCPRSWRRRIRFSSDQIRYGVALLAIHPASQDGQHHLESGRVEHGRSLYQGRKSATMSVDPVMGHYAGASPEMSAPNRPLTIWPDLGRFFAPYGVIQLWLEGRTRETRMCTCHCGSSAKAPTS